MHSAFVSKSEDLIICLMFKIQFHLTLTFVIALDPFSLNSAPVHRNFIRPHPPHLPAPSIFSRSFTFTITPPRTPHTRPLYTPAPYPLSNPTSHPYTVVQHPQTPTPDSSLAPVQVPHGDEDRQLRRVKDPLRRQPATPSHPAPPHIQFRYLTTEYPSRA